jgi:hypothetical protein
MFDLLTYKTSYPNEDVYGLNIALVSLGSEHIQKGRLNTTNLLVPAGLD